MRTLTTMRPSWATVIETGIDGVWVELESGSVMPIEASPDMVALLDAGVSVLVDVDPSGTAVPWSTVVVTRPQRDLHLVG